MSKTPRVTVVILSHRPKMLPAALASLFAQTEQDFQIIVQHCKDNWATKFNEAASIARGEFIVPLCDDDLLAPTYLEECLRVAERGGGADMIYTDRIHFDHVERRWYKPWTWRGIRPTVGIRVRQINEHYTEANAGPFGYFATQFPVDIFDSGSTLPMTCMIRRSWWERMKGYDPEMPHADTELWLRSAIATEPRCRFHYIPQPLFLYRQHPGQYSRTYLTSLQDAFTAYHAKHFRTFGVIWTGVSDGPGPHGEKWKVLVVAPEDREKVIDSLPALQSIAPMSDAPQLRPWIDRLAAAEGVRA